MIDPYTTHNFKDALAFSTPVIIAQRFDSFAQRFAIQHPPVRQLPMVGHLLASKSHIHYNGPGFPKWLLRAPEFVYRAIIACAG